MRRSSWALALGVVAAATLALAPTMVGAQSHEHPGGDDILPPGDWTDEQAAALHDLVERTEAALPAFSDPEALREMGFIDFGVSAPGFPGESAGYDHFINWDWIDDEHILDPEHPESLVFRVTWNSATNELDYELVSAMFFLPSQYGLEDMPEEYAWYPGWHTHENICVDETTFTFAGLTSNGTCRSGARVFDKPPMLHTWIVENPCGHRFGGIDVGGPHCDVHGHPGGPGSTTTTHPHGPTTTHPHGPTTTHPHGPTTTHPHGSTTTQPGDDDHDHSPPPAQPVHEHPDYAG
ncbi:MAG TPA: hypothetical protein VIL36_14800 [Acidimicrobiales bacterium]